MEREIVKIILVTLLIVVIALYFSKQRNFEVVLLAIALACAFFALNKKDTITMEAER